MDAGNLKQASRKNFVVPVVNLATNAQELDELAVGQIGIVDIDNSGDVPSYTFTNAPVDRKGHQFQIMQGTFANDSKNLLQTITTDFNKRGTTFKAADIVSWRGKKARKTTGTQKVAIGWDGINDDKNLNVPKYAQDTHIYLRFTGGPVNKIFGHNKGYRTSIVIPHECYSDCSGLDEGNPLCVTGNKERAADFFIEEWNRRQIGLQGGRPLTMLARATKITTRAISGLSNFVTYEVVVPDNGDNHSLGLVQSQLPGVELSRTSYFDGFSTYEVVLPQGSAAPAAIVNDKITTLAHCSVCPTGYTATTPRKKYLVTLAAGAATTQFSGVAGYVSNTPVNKQIGGVDTYFVLSTNATNETTFANAVATNGGSATFIGSDSAVCELTTPGSYSWVSGETLTRASKQFMITLEDDECGNTRLPELQTYYPTLTITGDPSPTSPTGSGTGCLRNYTTTVYSDLAEGGCFPDVHTFTKSTPTPFMGIHWSEVVTEQEDPDNVGIVLEGAVFKRNTDEALYDYWAYDQDDVDGVHIEVSTHSNNYSKDPCFDDIPVTTLSTFTYPSGEGWYVRRREEESNGYEMNQYRRNPALRIAFGQQYFSKLEKYYDAYYLEVVGSGPANGAFDPVADKRYMYTFYFETGRGKAFENAINGLIASSKSEILPVSI